MTRLTLSEYLKRQYGQKIYKIALSSGCTCPVRDETIGTGGCTFCSVGGSGEFAEKIAEEHDIDQQIQAAKERVMCKLPADLLPQEQKFIAYFQAYTNTYGDTDRLFRLYRKVGERLDITGGVAMRYIEMSEDDPLKLTDAAVEIREEEDGYEHPYSRTD